MTIQRALIVEDGGFEQLLIKGTVSGFNVLCDVVDSAEAALEKLCDPSVRYDLVITDNQLRPEGLRGIGLLTRIRFDEELKHYDDVSVIVHSSDDDPALPRAVEDLRARFVPKTPGCAALREELRRRGAV